MDNDSRSTGPVSNPIDLAVTHSIAVAQGILAERYRLDLDQALDLLDQHAVEAGLPIAEAARWLLTAGNLPGGPQPGCS
jgi:AmiR/NasT family two-component response regulator